MTRSSNVLGREGNFSEVGARSHTIRPCASAADAADAGPCATPHVFCDDFDDGPLGAKWDTSTVTTGGALALTPLDALTLPNALQASITDVTGEGEAELRKSLPAADHTRVAVDMVIASTLGATIKEIDMLALLVASPPAPYDFGDLNLERVADGGRLEEYLETPDGGSAGKDLPMAETYASMRHVVLDVDFPSQTFSVTIDGTIVQSMSLSPTVPKSALELGVGVAYAYDATGAWTVYVDDVVVDQW